MPEPLEPPGQDVEQKATQEFHRIQRQSALPIASLVILPAEGHGAILAGEEPSIADSYPMRVAGEVLENLLRACQRRFSVDHPLRLPQGRNKLAPGHRGRQGLALPMKAYNALSCSVTQGREKGAAEAATEHLNWEEEVAGARQPSRAIYGEATGEDQTMHMRMMMELLAPGMQDPQKADLRTQMFGISGNRAEGLRHRLKEQRIHRARILQRCTQLTRQGKTTWQ